MSLHKIVKKDGKFIVVDLFSGKRRPLAEEAYILSSLRIAPKPNDDDIKAKAG